MGLHLPYSLCDIPAASHKDGPVNPVVEAAPADPVTAEQVITSLAVLKVNWDRNNDYINNFVPFAVEALRLLGDPVVAVGDVQSKIASEFGLRIPIAALRTILSRAEK